MPGASPAEAPDRRGPPRPSDALAVRAVEQKAGAHPNDATVPEDGLQRVGGAPSPAAAARATPVGTRPAPAPTADDGDGPEVAEPARVHTEAGLTATGISGLDAQFGGGLPNGSLFLVTSDPTTATSIFAAQYAAAGIDDGDTVYYISLEHQASDVKAQVARYAQTEGSLERLRIIDGFPLQFRDMPADVRKRLGLQAGDDPIDKLEELVMDTGTVAPIRIVIESLTELLDRYEPARVMRLLRALRALVHALPGTALVMLVEPLHDAHTVALCKHVADGVIEFHVERKGFGIYPYIAVSKMRGVTGSARLLLFKETESGLWLESTKRVY